MITKPLAILVCLVAFAVPIASFARMAWPDASVFRQRNAVTPCTRRHGLADRDRFSSRCNPDVCPAG